MTGLRSEWVMRRVFHCDEGPVPRWWMGPHYDGEVARFSEPEDSTVFARRIDAEAAYRTAFGSITKDERAQRLGEALAEVSGGLGVPPGRGMKRSTSSPENADATRGPGRLLTRAEPPT